VVADRWLDPDTVDFSDLPQTVPPAGRAGMRPARPLPDAGTPPNMPDWSARGFQRPDMPPEPDDDGRRS
jgi:hypothetical protein